MSTEHTHRLLFDETIVAIITPPGEGGIAALRIAGKQSLSVFQKCFRAAIESGSFQKKPFLMQLGDFIDNDGVAIDQVTAVFMPEGKSYTGLDQVEIFCHGGRTIVNLILQTILDYGVRVALPGEFTQLAFLSGRIDLAKAEAVAEIIGANSVHSYESAREHLLGAYSEHINVLRERIIKILAEVEASIDFTDEADILNQNRLVDALDTIIGDVNKLLATYKGGRILKEGFTIAIAGRPNAGKSSLFNKMLNTERALVTPTAGTTRDYLSEWIDLDGYTVNIIDTAGLREGGGKIERAGIASSKSILSKADLVIWMVDLSSRGWKKKLQEDIRQLMKSSILLIGNKIDLLGGSVANEEVIAERELVLLSCQTGKGMASLRKNIIKAIESEMPDLTSGILVTSARHCQKLKNCLKQLKRAHKKMRLDDLTELIAADLHAAVREIDEITGRIYTEELLGKIFSEFCIGK